MYESKQVSLRAYLPHINIKLNILLSILSFFVVSSMQRIRLRLFVCLRIGCRIKNVTVISKISRADLNRFGTGLFQFLFEQGLLIKNWFFGPSVLKVLKTQNLTAKMLISCSLVQEF